jgi:hypothetical protein
MYAAGPSSPAGAQAQGARPREHPAELRRRVAALAAVEADAGELAAERPRGVERGERVVLGEVAQEAQDQLGARAVAGQRVLHRVAQAADHGLERDAARGVGLRVEEQLGVDHAVGVRAREVRHRERVEVAAVAQDVAAGVVEIEERLQVVERVGGADRLDRGVRERHAVLGRQAEHHLRLEGALDVEVELHLREAADQPLAGGRGVGIGHGGRA